MPQSLHIDALQVEVLSQHSTMGGNPVWEEILNSVLTDLQGLTRVRTDPRWYKCTQMAIVW